MRIYMARTLNEAYCHHNGEYGFSSNGRDHKTGPEVIRLGTGPRPKVKLMPIKGKHSAKPVSFSPLRPAQLPLVKVKPTVVKRLQA